MQAPSPIVSDLSVIVFLATAPLLELLRDKYSFHISDTLANAALKAAGEQ